MLARRIKLPPLTVVVLALVGIFLGACHAPAKPSSAHTVLAWEPVASWSGNADYQTDSFNIGTGQWRIKWEAQNQPAGSGGSFRVDVHSSVSGRFVMTSVTHQGSGQGVAYVAEDPREFFLVVESRGLNWKVAVEQGATVEQ